MNAVQFREHLKKHHISLNPQQQRAVEAVQGPTLLLAVPGSGKTTTLIARIGFMIFCCGLDPGKILTLTYTNAATRDMERRFQEIFGKMGDGEPDHMEPYNQSKVRFQTINSLANGIITEYVKQTQGNRFALVSDNAPIISQLYRSVYQDFPTEGDVSDAAQTIAYIKNMRLSEEERSTLMIGEHDAEPLYRAYVQQMRRNRQMDFDDQLTIALQILVKLPEIRQRFRRRYPYILVDEAQDTSKIQHEIIALLAGDAPNLFMVGDEDQSIYGFRAAYPQALLDFEKTYERASVLLLEENYRSTPQIVDAASRFIAVNRNRKEKNMRTSRPSGSKIDYLRLDSRYGQYAYLMKCLQDVKTDTAVLMRNNDSAIPLIYYLRKNGIPYRSRGMETSFFSHRVVRDVQDFTAFAKDPANPDLFLRIYYKVGLKIRKEHALDAVRRYDPDKDKGLFHTYRRLHAKGKGREKIQQVIDEFAALKKDTAWEAISRIQYKLRKTTESEREKFFILRVLTEHGEHVEKFFQRMEHLRQAIAEKTSDPGARVHISTVHSAKGLEYSEVYIIDAVDGIMPMSDAEDIEEERRIFYVAVTRAKNRLHLVCYKDQKMPFVDILQGKGQKSGGAISVLTSGRNSSSTLTNTYQKKNRRTEYKLAADFFCVGDRISHTTLGSGTVIALDEDKVAVRFDTGRESKLMAEYSVVNGLIEML